jgi:Zn-dependent M28 family amino/carboxypeptidase
MSSKLTFSIISKLTIFFFLFTPLLSCTNTNLQNTLPDFDENNAFNHIKKQLSFGPRIPDSNGHNKTRKYIIQQLEQNKWETEIKEINKEHRILNIIGKFGSGEPLVLIGAHYDTRLISDRDPNNEKISTPVPGANDGASGVAVLLELARILPETVNNHQEFGNSNIKQVWLVFFDVEDNGSIPGWEWILGSRAFAESLDIFPAAVIVLDMIGDENLKIYQEKNSDPELTKEIWDTADILGYNEAFIPQSKYRILDDHVPFLEKGIKAVDIIDFEYPYWHTTEDTIDKISPESLKIVGDTVYIWLINKQFVQ